jgi:hypothetical protein
MNECHLFILFDTHAMLLLYLLKSRYLMYIGTALRRKRKFNNVGRWFFHFSCSHFIFSSSKYFYIFEVRDVDSRECKNWDCVTYDEMFLSIDSIIEVKRRVKHAIVSVLPYFTLSARCSIHFLFKFQLLRFRVSINMSQNV